MTILQDLLTLREAEDLNPDVPKAVNAIKRKLKEPFGREQVKITLTPSGNKIVILLEFNRTLTEKEFDYAVDDLKDAIEKADESGRWEFKDTGSYFADPSALMPKRGVMMDQGALLCDIEYTVTVPNTIRKKR